MQLKTKNCRIYDNLYGFIDLDQELFEPILKNPFFLRLHNISQMGLTYYVFPDAFHTRYSHSLGVYHIATKMMEAQSNNFQTIEPIRTEYKRQIQMSALLHDVGHVPFSHSIEYALKRFYRDQQNENENAVDDILFGKGQAPKGSDYKLDNEFDTKLHEHLGSQVIINTSLKDDIARAGINPLKVSDGFMGITEENEPESIDLSLSQNFIHSQLDADRIDYLLRDASFSGVNSGFFDFDKLLSEIRYTHDGKNYGINFDGLRAFEQFVVSRFSAYAQIVFHRKVHSYDYLISDFYYRLLILIKINEHPLLEGIEIYDFSELNDLLKTNPEKFLSFTDSFIHELIRKVSSIETGDYVIDRYTKLLWNKKPLKVVRFEEYFATVEEEEKRDSLLKTVATEEGKERLAYLAGVHEEDIITPPPLSVSFYNCKNRRDKVNVFYGDMILFEDVSDADNCL